VQLLQAAAVVEDVSLQGYPGGGELLAALKPACGTLRALDFTDVDTGITSRLVRTATISLHLKTSRH
jgi:hypothetical protein